MKKSTNAIKKATQTPEQNTFDTILRDAGRLIMQTRDRAIEIDAGDYAIHLLTDQILEVRSVRALNVITKSDVQMVLDHCTKLINALHFYQE